MAKALENEDANLKNRAAVARLSWQPRSHDPHLPKWLHLIDVPTLLVWGDDDKLFPEAVGREYARLIPNSELAVLPACGHMPNVEKADEFVGRIRRFTGGPRVLSRPRFHFDSTRRSTTGAGRPRGSPLPRPFHDQIKG